MKKILIIFGLYGAPIIAGPFWSQPEEKIALPNAHEIQNAFAKTNLSPDFLEQLQLPDTFAEKEMTKKEIQTSLDAKFTAIWSGLESLQGDFSITPQMKQEFDQQNLFHY